MTLSEMREKWASRRQEGADFNARVDLTTVCEAVLQDIDNLLAHQESEVLTLAEAERLSGEEKPWGWIKWTFAVIGGFVALILLVLLLILLVDDY